MAFDQHRAQIPRGVAGHRHWRGHAVADHAGAPGRLREALSESELRVLGYLPTNLSRPEMASELYLSVHTIKTHIQHLYAKLDAHDRSEAVGRALPRPARTFVAQALGQGRLRLAELPGSMLGSSNSDSSATWGQRWLLTAMTGDGPSEMLRCMDQLFILGCFEGRSRGPAGTHVPRNSE